MFYFKRFCIQINDFAQRKPRFDALVSAELELLAAHRNRWQKFLWHMYDPPFFTLSFLFVFLMDYEHKRLKKFKINL